MCFLSFAAGIGFLSFFTRPFTFSITFLEGFIISCTHRLNYGLLIQSTAFGPFPRIICWSSSCHLEEPQHSHTFSRTGQARTRNTTCGGSVRLRTEKILVGMSCIRYHSQPVHMQTAGRSVCYRQTNHQKLMRTCFITTLGFFLRLSESKDSCISGMTRAKNWCITDMLSKILVLDSAERQLARRD